MSVATTSRRLPLPRFALPGDLRRQPLVEPDARLPAEVPLQLTGVRERVALIARAGRFAANLRLPAGDRLQLLQDVPDRRRLAAADIIRLAHRRARRGHGRFHAVADVGVTAYLQAVAEDGDRPAVE